VTASAPRARLVLEVPAYTGRGAACL